MQVSSQDFTSVKFLSPIPEHLTYEHLTEAFFH